MRWDGAVRAALLLPVSLLGCLRPLSESYNEQRLAGEQSSLSGDGSRDIRSTSCSECGIPGLAVPGLQNEVPDMCPGLNRRLSLGSEFR